MSIVLSVILAVTNVILVALFVVALVKSRAILHEVREKMGVIDDQLHSFITPVNDKDGSPLYQISAAFADTIARSVVAHAKAHLMGKSSAAARGDKAVETDIKLDLVSATNPLIQAVLDKFPRLEKTLRRNPALIDVAMEKFANFGLGGPKVVQNVEPSQPGSNGHEQAEFNLKI